MSGLNELGVLDSTVGKLREGLAVFKDTLGLHLETTLLRHGGVPTIGLDRVRHIQKVGVNEKNTHVVGGQESAEEKDIDGGRELILGWVMGGHVNNRVDIGLSTDV